MDIVGSLPAELQHMILGYLGNPDLCRSMRVSKTWKRVCLDPSLWRHLTFVRSTGRPLNKRVFNKIISIRAQGKVKRLTLCGLSKLRIDLPIFKATLKLLKQLESLSLRGVSELGLETGLGHEATPSSDEWSMTLFTNAPRGLKTLHFGNFRPVNVNNLWQAPSAIPMAQSLEELHLSELYSGSAVMKLLLSTVWPRLRKLTMSPLARHESWIPCLQFDLLKLSRVTPTLKDLCIYSLYPLMMASTPLLEHLERLELTVLIPENRLPLSSIPVHFEMATGTLRSMPRLSPTIRSLEFPDRAFGVLHAYEAISRAHPLITPDSHVLPPVTELEGLEHLYWRDTGPPSYRGSPDNLTLLTWFTDLIKPSMSNGTLTSLAITFSPDTQFAFDRVLDKSAIRTLSCFDFIDEEYDSRCGNKFATWVRGFTNLTTLGVFPQRTENCWMHVVKVLSTESRIETIYTNALTGIWRDEALKKAHEKGIKIIEASRIPEPVLQPSDP